MPPFLKRNNNSVLIKEININKDTQVPNGPEKSSRIINRHIYNYYSYKQSHTIYIILIIIKYLYRHCVTMSSNISKVSI